MTALISEGSRNDEILHIREDVEERYEKLKKRKGRWLAATSSMGAGSLFLIGGGLFMLFLGQLPETIDLVSPSVEAASSGVASSSTPGNGELAEIYETMRSFLEGTLLKIISVIMVTMGIISGVARQDFMVMAMSLAGGIGLYYVPQVLSAVLGGAALQLEPGPFAVIQEQFDEAANSEDWHHAWELIEPISASESDMAMLKAQIAFQAGHANESLSLIKEKGLGADYPSQVWRLESLYANTPSGHDHQLTEPSQAYEVSQESRQAQSKSMLKLSAPLGGLALITGAITIVLRRNIKAIEAWFNSNNSGQTE